MYLVPSRESSQFTRQKDDILPLQSITLQLNAKPRMSCRPHDPSQSSSNDESGSIDGREEEAAAAAAHSAVVIGNNISNSSSSNNESTLHQTTALPANNNGSTTNGPTRQINYSGINNGGNNNNYAENNNNSRTFGNNNYSNDSRINDTATSINNNINNGSLPVCPSAPRKPNHDDVRRVIDSWNDEQRLRATQRLRTQRIQHKKQKRKRSILGGIAASTTAVGGAAICGGVDSTAVAISALTFLSTVSAGLFALEKRSGKRARRTTSQTTSNNNNAEGGNNILEGGNEQHLSAKQWNDEKVEGMHALIRSINDLKLARSQRNEKIEEHRMLENTLTDLRRQNEEMRTKFERDSAELVQCEHELRGAQTNIDMSREGTNQLGGKLKHVIR